MNSYEHSFRLFELLVQQEIQSAHSIDEIEAYLKSQDKELLAIEGGDYDGVYMYYKGRYIYSWDTPYSVYEQSGYDATQRPWYIGAVEADGEIFFSTPYPSYANDYMLATISRLQDDGETVIAYDIKLGEIGRYVDRLNLYQGALALICDSDGNIIGSTDRLYQGGNYLASAQQLSEAVNSARAELEKAGAEDESAVTALESAKAQQRFVEKESDYMAGLVAHKGLLRYSLKDFSYGFAHAIDEYTCFVITPIATQLLQIAVFWAAMSFVLIAVCFLITRMMRRNYQILCDALTGLNNRRAFQKYCDNHILHHADEQLGLLMLDLNHFKKINDYYGHTVGDQALQDAATVLKGACAASADHYFLCRYGGDEFLLASRVSDISALGQMRLLISNGFGRKNLTSTAPYCLEASMGVSCGMCMDRESMELLLAQADQAMYEEKQRMGFLRD